MKEKLEQLKALLDEILALMDDSPSVPPPEVQAEDSEFSLLKSLLESQDWPMAVPPAQIADDNSERDKEERAEGICGIILPPLLKKKFLDFGCGEGHVAKCASKEASLSVGYDLIRSPSSSLPWEETQGNFFLTSDFEKVIEAGPYDFVLLYDVLDHVVSESHTDVLNKAASVLADEGRIFLRCHPWCGRHGGHAYKKINKAFVHLVFSEEEMELLGLGKSEVNKTLAPLHAYGEFIKSSGLVAESEPEIDSQEVEDFFRDNETVRGRILRRWSLNDWGDSPPNFQMSQCFVDYVLKKK